MKIKANYKSYFFVSVLPSIIFLSVIVLVAYRGIRYFGSDRIWVNLLIFVVGVLSAIAVIMLISPLIKKLGSLKKGVLEITEDTIIWKTGFKKRTISTSEKYTAFIYSGKAAANVYDVIDNTIITIEDEKNNIAVSLRGMRYQEAIAYFKEESFVYNYSFTPESGIAAFDLSYKKASHRDCVAGLLGLLWKNKDNNKFYVFHHSLPWDVDIEPEELHAEILDNENQNDRAVINSIQQAAIINYQNKLYVTENYVLAHGDFFDKDSLDFLNEPVDADNLYAQFPVGYCFAGLKMRAGRNNTMESCLELFSLVEKQNKITVNIPIPVQEFENDDYLQLMTVQRYVNYHVVG